MSPWLTFVIGVILGLLIGWLIDLFYRRRDTTASVAEVETRATPPDWVAPRPAAPVEPAVMPSETELLAEAPLSDVQAPPLPAAPEPPVIPESPEAPELSLAAEVPAVQAASAELELPAAPAVEPPAVELPAAPEPELPAVELPAAPAVELPAIELPPAPDLTATEAAFVAETSVEPEASIEGDMAAGAVEPVALAELDRGEAADWPEVSREVAEVAVEAPAAEAHITDEIPMGVEGLPPAAVEALSPDAAGAMPVDMPLRTVAGRDKLIVIEGIGPVYEKKLNAAGINTFKQLVETSEERLRAIIQPQSWQRVKFDEWIEQAQLIIEGKDAELQALQARLFSRKRG